MKRYKKVYIEISNVCNMNCSFCPKTKRDKRVMSILEFEKIAVMVKKQTDYIYLHVLGEPMLHPGLDEILEVCDRLDLNVCITTNGTLLKSRGALLINSPSIHKVSISLHSFEGNENSFTIKEYIRGVIEYVKQAFQIGQICSLRLWNVNGESVENDNIVNMLKENFGDFEYGGRNNYKLEDKVYLQIAEKFDWPDMDVDIIGDKGFCYGLRDQFAILVDGSVVPCCLDHDGDINLGNVFQDDLENIINSSRAKAIYDGFSARKAVEELCKKCSYKERF